MNLAPVVSKAAKRGLKVLFHNDDIKTESAEVLISVIGHLGKGRAGMCLDFGNFATRSAAYALDQLRMLAPYASATPRMALRKAASFMPMILPLP